MCFKLIDVCSLVFHFGGTAVIGRLQASSTIPRNQWVSVIFTVATDGTVTLFTNDVVVARSTTPIPLPSLSTSTRRRVLLGRAWADIAAGKG